MASGGSFKESVLDSVPEDGAFSAVSSPAAHASSDLADIDIGRKADGTASSEVETQGSAVETLQMGADVSSRVLEQALARADSSPSLGAYRHPNSESEPEEAPGRDEITRISSAKSDIGRASSSDSTDAKRRSQGPFQSQSVSHLAGNFCLSPPPSDRGQPRQGSGFTIMLDKAKRGIQRLMVDRNTLHEFDMDTRFAKVDSVPPPDRSQDDSIHFDPLDPPGRVRSAGDAVQDIHPDVSGVDHISLELNRSPKGSPKKTPQSPSSILARRGLSRSLSMVEGKQKERPGPALNRKSFSRQTSLTLQRDASFGGGDGLLRERSDGGARLRGSIENSVDLRRSMVKERYQAQRKKINHFATVLSKEDSQSVNVLARRDVDQKYMEEPGGNPDVVQDSLKDGMKGSVPLHPNSAFRMVWDSIMFVTTVFALIFDPLSIAFTADEQSPTSFFVVSDRIVMSIFFCDIILNFLTGYVDKKDQRIIMHWRDVATNYIKFWFLIDLVSSLPPEAFEGFSENSVVKGARVSKLLRCFKISRLARIVQVLQLNLDIKLSHFMWKIIVWASCCFLWVHWTTCAECWVWVMADSDFRKIDLPGVVEMKGGDPDCLSMAACNARYYLRGLRTAIAFMCGHDQATGPTVSEDTIAVICSLSGSILYSSFIAVCISLLMEMDAERVRYMGQVERLNHYMGRRNVPMNLRQRVREYMELTWINSGGTDDYEVLAFVSRSLRRELAMHNAAKLIAGVPFLNAGSGGFVFSVSQMLRPEAFMANDDIMIRGEIGQEMFLLERGIVDIMEHDDTTVIASLGPGAWFGEIALQHKTLRTATIRAHTDGNLYVLHRDDFLKLTPYFPEVADELRKSNERIIREISRHKAAVLAGETTLDPMGGIAISEHVQPLDFNCVEGRGGTEMDPREAQDAKPDSCGPNGESREQARGKGAGAVQAGYVPESSDDDSMVLVSPAKAQAIRMTGSSDTDGGRGQTKERKMASASSAPKGAQTGGTLPAGASLSIADGGAMSALFADGAVSSEVAFAGFDGELVHEKSAHSKLAQ